MDKITKEKFLSSNLPWVFDYNQKPAEEIKPAGSFDRLSNEKHTNKNHSNNCATVSQEARKESPRPRSFREVCPGTALCCSCSALPQRSLRTQTHPSQTAFWDPIKRCNSTHLWTQQNAKSTYKRIFSYIKTARGGEQWGNGGITVHHHSQIKFKFFVQWKRDMH